MLVYRQKYMDGIKGIAMLIVFTTHFVAFWCPEYFRFWDYFVLKGTTGKLGVALFGVVLGYYARKNTKDLEQSIIHRYIYFAVCGIFVNLLYVLVGRIISNGEEWSILSALYEGVLLGDKLFPTFWCIPSFLIASIISYVNASVNATMRLTIAEILLSLLFTKEPWIAICLMGNIVYIIYYSDSNKSSTLCVNKYLIYGITFLLWLLTKREESVLTYIIDGLFAMLIVLSVHYSVFLQRIFNVKLLSFMGNYSMSIFLIHVLVYQVLGDALFDCFAFINHKLALLMVWTLCLLFCMTIAIPIDKLLKKVTVLISSVL